MSCEERADLDFQVLGRTPMLLCHVPELQRPTLFIQENVVRLDISRRTEGDKKISFNSCYFCPDISDRARSSPDAPPEAEAQKARLGLYRMSPSIGPRVEAWSTSPARFREHQGHPEGSFREATSYRLLSLRGQRLSRSSQKASTAGSL